jgi:PAS domain-containing protein
MTNLALAVGNARETVMVNDACCELVGRSKKELLNTRPLDILCPRDRALAKRYDDLRLCADNWFHLKMPDGNNLMVWIHATPWPESQGRLRLFQIIPATAYNDRRKGERRQMAEVDVTSAIALLR